MAVLPVKQIKGLVPLLDRKKIPDPFIFDATNTRVDVNGPYSGFGWLQEAGANIGTITHFEDFEFGSDFYYGTNLGVCLYQKQAKRFFYLFENGTNFTDKWTFADVGGLLYFCNKDVGIVQFNPLDGALTSVDISLYGTAYAITESNNRLCILAKGFIAWSAQDNGADLTPSTATGAGNQSISKLGSHTEDADYFDIVAIPDGFLSFTKRGIMKSTSLNSVNPFRHNVFSRDRRLFNKQCICKLNDYEWLFLSSTGLFKTDGKKVPEPWQPLLSEQLLNEVAMLPNKDSVGLFYNRTERLVGAGLSTSGAGMLFNKTYVVDLPSENIGILNELFFSRFIEIFTQAGLDVPKHGYITLNRDLVLFTNQPNMQNWLEYDALFFRVNEEPSLYTDENGVIDAITYGIITEEPLNLISPATGYYTPTYADTFPASGTFNPISYATSVAAVLGLNCQFTMGLFRFSSEEIVDILGIVTTVELGTLDPFETIGDELVDWLLDFGSTDVIADWNTMTGEEDWGEGVATGASYRQTIFSSLDGYAEWKPIFNELNEIAVEGKLKFCSSRQEGLYFGIKIMATEIDEFVHLKTLHANVIPAGRLL